MKHIFVGIFCATFSLSGCVQTTPQGQNAVSNPPTAQSSRSLEEVINPALQACFVHATGGNADLSKLRAVGAKDASLGRWLTIPYAGTYKKGLFNLPNSLGLIFDKRSLAGVLKGCEVTTQDPAGGSAFPALILKSLAAAGFTASPPERRGFYYASRGSEKIYVSLVRKRDPNVGTIYTANIAIAKK